MVALFEAQALLGNPLIPGGVVANPRQAWIVLNVTVSLQNVVDLSSIPNRNTIAMTAQELTGDWLGYATRSLTTSVRGSRNPAPTQRLGPALATASRGFEAIETISARVPHCRNLVVFPSYLDPASQIVFDHPHRRTKFVVTEEHPDGQIVSYDDERIDEDLEFE